MTCRCQVVVDIRRQRGIQEFPVVLLNRSSETKYTAAILCLPPFYRSTRLIPTVISNNRRICVQCENAFEIEIRYIQCESAKMYIVVDLFIIL